MASIQDIIENNNSIDDELVYFLPDIKLILEEVVKSAGLTDEEILTIFGWDIAESEDGSGDIFAYWDHENGEPPKWATWATSCECVESLIESFKESDECELLQAQLQAILKALR